MTRRFGITEKIIEFSPTESRVELSVCGNISPDSCREYSNDHCGEQTRSGLSKSNYNRDQGQDLQTSVTPIESTGAQAAYD